MLLLHFAMLALVCAIAAYWVMKIATPPTVGFMVQIVKNTSLASAIGFVELVRAGQMINNATFRPFIVFVLIAALYFALCYPLSAWSRRLEGKFDVAHR